MAPTDTCKISTDLKGDSGHLKDSLDLKGSNFLEQACGGKDVVVAPVVAAGYALDSEYTVSVDPVAHFDASDMNGNGDGNSGWSDDDDTTSSAPWVSRIGDYSVYQSSAAIPARFKTGQINSKPAVTPNLGASIAIQMFRLNLFDASASSSAEINLTFDGGYHIFFAVHTIDLSSNWRYMRKDSAFELYKAGLTNMTIRPCTAGSCSPIQQFTIANSETKDHWWEYRAFDDGGTLSSVVQQHLDGSSVVTETPVTSQMDADIAFFGYASWNAAMHEKVAEMLFFNEELTAEDRGKVEDYLDAKYAITDS